MNADVRHKAPLMTLGHCKEVLEALAKTMLTHDILIVLSLSCGHSTGSDHATQPEITRTADSAATQTPASMK